MPPRTACFVSSASFQSFLANQTEPGLRDVPESSTLMPPPLPPPQARITAALVPAALVRRNFLRDTGEPAYAGSHDLAVINLSLSSKSPLPRESLLLLPFLDGFCSERRSRRTCKFWAPWYLLLLPFRSDSTSSSLSLREGRGLG